VQNARINYTLKLLKQPLVGNIGDIIEINGVLLDELEEEDLSNKLIEEGYYESMGWPSDWYTVVNRSIEIFNENY
jgi:hypothetical protein